MKFKEFFKALFDYHNTSRTITSHQFDDICRSIGLKSKATFSNYKRQCLLKNIIIKRGFRKYVIDIKHLIAQLDYGNTNQKKNDMEDVIKTLSLYKGDSYRTYKELRDFIYEDIAKTTSMVTADTITRQLILSGYITYDADRGRYIIGNNTDTPRRHNHTREEKRHGIRDMLRTYTTDLPKKIIAWRLWKKGVFVSLSSVARALCEG